MLAGKRILLIVAGGIAAFKSLDLIRRLKERGAEVTPVLTKAGAEFVTPLSVAALAGGFFAFLLALVVLREVTGADLRAARAALRGER